LHIIELINFISVILYYIILQ